MQIDINKIGKIKEATINIDGLTIIAGKNDTGKSTVGKVLYATFRALEMYKWYFDERHMLRIESRFFRPLLKKYTEIDSSSELGRRCAGLLIELRDAEESEKIRRGILTLEKIETITKQIEENGKLTPEISELIGSISHDLEQLHKMPMSEKLRETLTATLRTMFVRFINNSKYREKASVEIFNGKTQLLKSAIENDRVEQLHLNEKNAFPFGDILYLETPFILEYGLAFYKPNWMELQDKINDVKRDPSRDDEINAELVGFIQREILKDSVIALDEKEREFFYQVDSQSSKLPITDAACGIRSFALLFVLLKYNILTRDMLLVLDEPENHLHPEFQIKYAEMIALLVKEGFTVVLTSHSPTFIQALSGFVRSYNIKEKTSFYLASQVEKENYSRLDNVTNNISKIFESLVFPLEQLFRNV